jgi:DNA-binding SARP family transcriptional activator
MTDSAVTAGVARPRVVLLGGFQIMAEGGAVPVPAAAQRLVALLALRSGPVSRSDLRATLWPDVAEQAANGRLRTALWRVGRLHDGLVRASPTHLRLAGEAAVDIHETAARARRLLAPPEVEAAELSREALAGELLPGWYDDWVIFERERLNQLMLHALEALAVRLLALGRHGLAADAAYAAIQADPLRESAQRVLIQIHLAEGNASEALRRYHAYAGLLRRELGILPSGALTELVFPRGRPTVALRRGDHGRGVSAAVTRGR